MLMAYDETTENIKKYGSTKNIVRLKATDLSFSFLNLIQLE